MVIHKTNLQLCMEGKINIKVFGDFKDLSVMFTPTIKEILLVTAF